MRGRSYEDFDLLIERFGDAYRARVQRSPGGEGEAEFRLPFSEAEIEKLLRRLAWSRRRVRQLRPSPVRAEGVKHFGERLFHAVFTGKVEARFRHSLDLAVSPGRGLRLRLRFNGVPELARLPWEYLYDSQRGYLGLSEETPIVRYPELSRPVQPLPVLPPLHVLVVISNPEGTAPLDADEEWSQINEALADPISRGLLVLECLTSPTLEELCVRLRAGSGHVLHFIGHGVFDRELGEGSLAFADGNGQTVRVSGGELAAVLSPQKISLAVLNACEGARHAEADAFAGVAQALVQREVPAVIAMQSEISDKAAISFAAHFYRLLAEYFPVDGALSEARKGMLAAGYKVEWGIPILYMRSKEGQLFSPPEEPLPRRSRSWWTLGGGALALLVLAVGYAVMHPARQEPGPPARPSTAVQEQRSQTPHERDGAPMIESRRVPSSQGPPPAPAPEPPKEKAKTAVKTLPPPPPECPSPPGTDIRFVLIKAGSFEMGSNRKGEKPSHLVTITRPFCLGQYEVKERQWRQVMEGKPDPSPQDEDSLPVQVTWEEATEFVRRLNDAVGRDLYRLPSEAEWEYAARAGTKSQYFFGNDPLLLHVYGNCTNHSAPSDGFEYRAPVGSFQPNDWGLYDMHGNVWEWVEDWYSEEYPPGPAIDPRGPSTGTLKVRRGGGYEASAFNCRSSARKCSAIDFKRGPVGFRLVEDIDNK